MSIKIKESYVRHIKTNFLIYFIVILCLMIGISAGAITIKVLDEDQKRQLISFLDSFFKILNESEVSGLSILKVSIMNNLQTVLIVWLLGVLIIGIPIIMVVLILRGFIIGFTVGFLIDGLGIKGFLFALFAILPQNIFIIPCIVIVSVIAIKFAFTIVKCKFKKIRYNYFKRLLTYSSTILIISLLIIIGSLIEAYITPIFLKLISSYIY